MMELVELFPQANMFLSRTRPLWCGSSSNTKISSNFPLTVCLYFHMEVKQA